MKVFPKIVPILTKQSREMICFTHQLITLYSPLMGCAAQPEIAQAVEEANKTSELCQKYRKSQSITTSVSKYLWKPNYNDYSEGID